MQFVEHLIKRVFSKPLQVDIEDISERRAPDPVRHGMLGARRDQSIERHHTGEPLHCLRKPALAQNAIRLKPAPELIADMHRPSLAMALARHAAGIDLDQARVRARWRRCTSGRLAGLPPLYPPKDSGDFAVSRVEQIGLPDKRILDLVRKLEPLRARARAEVAERADRLLTRPLRGVDRLHEQVIGIAPALVGANRFAQVHAHYES